MDIDKIDRIEYVLGAPSFLVPVRKLTHGHRYIQAREVSLREYNLFSEFLVRKDVVI